MGDFYFLYFYYSTNIEIEFHINVEKEKKEEKEGLKMTRQKLEVNPQDIKKAIEKSGLSEAKFAKKAGININTLIKYKQGKIQNPREEVFNKINTLVRSTLKNNKKKVDYKKERTTIPSLPYKEKIHEINVPRVRALISYEVVTEVDLDVVEKITNTSPLTTERIYQNPKNMRVRSVGMEEGRFDILKILHELIESEPVPQYIR